MLENKLKNLPDHPGIYLFYNSKKELIYVGKATSLRSRVRSYFCRGSFDSAPRAPLRMTASRPIEQLIDEVKDVKCIVTDSVLEAVILEANYIKKFQPKYNVDLKDDKSWVHICITKDEYPKVVTVREHELKNFKFSRQSTGSRISSGQISNFKLTFGPYPSLKTKETMSLLRKLFSISVCKPCEHGKPCRPCLYYQLGQCLGVCTGEISSSDYKKKVIKPLVQFLSGKKKSLLKNLEREMKLASKNHEFEEAGRLRDQIRQLNRIQDIALLNKSFVESPVIARSEVRATRQSHVVPEIASSFTSFIPRNDIRIEGYDISNLGSSNMVGSMVVFERGEPNKSQYRKFKIKTVKGQSDVDCLVEVLERRLKHNEWEMPNVILVDGGLAQVNAIIKRLKDYKISVPVVGIIKGPERKRNDFIIRSDEMSRANFVKWVNENQNLLIKVRDEAHRFAINYQRQLRKIK